MTASVLELEERLVALERELAALKAKVTFSKKVTFRTDDTRGPDTNPLVNVQVTTSHTTELKSNHSSVLINKVVNSDTIRSENALSVQLEERFPCTKGGQAHAALNSFAYRYVIGGKKATNGAEITAQDVTGASSLLSGAGIRGLKIGMLTFGEDDGDKREILLLRGGFPQQAPGTEPVTKDASVARGLAIQCRDSLGPPPGHWDGYFTIKTAVSINPNYTKGIVGTAFYATAGKGKSKGELKRGVHINGATEYGLKIDGAGYASGAVIINTKSAPLVVNGVPVLGGRRRAWSPPIGRGSRAAFDADSATVATTARTLKAVIEDLIEGGILRIRRTSPPL